MKKTISILMALIMVLAAFTVSFAAVALPSDALGNEALSEALEELMERGAVTGDTDGLFHPEQNLTRAQVSAIIVRAIGLSDEDLERYASLKRFNDLENAKWAAPFINFMAETGIASGYPDGGFGPSNNVTIGELFTFLDRACGIDPDEREEGAHWAAGYVNSAVTNGFLKNVELPEDLNGFASKAQAVIAIYNGKDKLVKPEAPAEDSKTEEESGKDESTPESGSADTGSTEESHAGTVVNTVPIGANVGNSGKYYVVINDVESVRDSAHDDAVAEIEALIGGKEREFLANPSGELTAMLDNLSGTGAFEGTVYELNIKNDEVRDIATLGSKEYAALGTVKNQYFKEIRETALTAGSWLTVLDADSERNMVKLKDADGSELGWVEINPEAAIYFLDKDGEDYEYEASSVKSLKEGRLIRLYQINKHDGDTVADIIVFKKADA